MIVVLWLVNAAGVLGRVSRGSLHYSNSIVIKDGWNVFRWELVGSIGDQEAGLSNSTITDDDTPRGPG